MTSPEFDSSDEKTAGLFDLMGVLFVEIERAGGAGGLIKPIFFS